MDLVRLAREDWLRGARLALLRHGIDGVRVERLARELGVTKGSFYWHFRDLAELKEALLAEWEAERGLLEAALDGPDAVRRLIVLIGERVLASERGEVPSDAAIFRWAAVDPVVAPRVAAAEADRIALMRRLAPDPRKGELFYMAYLGFILRRRHAPEAGQLLQILADFASQQFGIAP